MGKAEASSSPEPLDVAVRHGVEDVIPTGGPFDVVVLCELDAVGVSDSQVLLKPLAWNAHGFIGVANILVLQVVLQTANRLWTE